MKHCLYPTLNNVVGMCDPKHSGQVSSLSVLIRSSVISLLLFWIRENINPCLVMNESLQFLRYVNLQHSLTRQYYDTRGVTIWADKNFPLLVNYEIFAFKGRVSV